jgi:putative ABC transport system permease protein
VIGKQLKLNRRRDYTITAVYKDAPSNTQLKPDILLSYASFIKLAGPDNNPETAWTWDGCLTYLLLRKDADPAVVEKKFIPVTEQFTA